MRTLADSSAAIAGALAFVVMSASACTDACRSISTQKLELACSTSSSFVGEIHFDDGATFANFLEVDCLPDATDTDRTAILNKVDFTKSAVFVAAGARSQTARCISDREGDGVSVCDDGLRVAFADTITDTSPCNGKWTVAFSLPRAEMRAALETKVGAR